MLKKLTLAASLALLFPLCANADTNTGHVKFTGTVLPTPAQVVLMPGINQTSGQTALQGGTLHVNLSDRSVSELSNKTFLNDEKVAFFRIVLSHANTIYNYVKTAKVTLSAESGDINQGILINKYQEQEVDGVQMNPATNVGVAIKYYGLMSTDNETQSASDQLTALSKTAPQATFEGSSTTYIVGNGPQTLTNVKVEPTYLFGANLQRISDDPLIAGEVEATLTVTVEYN